LSKYEKVSFVIIFDSDLRLGWDIDGIAHSFGLLESTTSLTATAAPDDIRDWTFHATSEHAAWDAVCSNGIVPQQENRYYDSLAYVDQSFGLRNFRNHQNIIHPFSEASKIIFSCFGGLAIYKKQVQMIHFKNAHERICAIAFHVGQNFIQLVQYIVCRIDTGTRGMPI
jgi:hypothetical protein